MAELTTGLGILKRCDANETLESARQATQGRSHSACKLLGVEFRLIAGIRSLTLCHKTLHNSLGREGEGQPERNRQIVGAFRPMPPGADRKNFDHWQLPALLISVW